MTRTSPLCIVRSVMKKRILVPERMDDPDLDQKSHFRALRGLQRINRWTGNASLVWRPILQLATKLNRGHLTLLDVATGSADIPIQLAARAARAGITLQIDACDVSPQALELATASCARVDLPIRLFPLDLLKDEVVQRYDVVMCSQFLHHLTIEQAQRILTGLRAAARHRVIVVDLIRSRWNWWQVWFASHVLSRSPVVHFDGPQSVRAAYTIRELEAIVQQAGFDSFRIRSHWPCRFVLVGNVNGD